MSDEIDRAFINGEITEQEYKEACGVYIDSARATVHNGKIYTVFMGRFPFEKTEQDLRHDKEYKEWRENVFERDHYTCQKCGQVGGKLNAHHIKKFKDYPKLRFKLSNGITLCESCHRKLHIYEREQKRLHKTS